MNTSNFALVSQHIPALRACAIKFTKDSDLAQDLVQETLLKAFLYYGKFQEGTNLEGWLFTIMRNNFINNFNKTTRTNSLIEQSAELDSNKLIYSYYENDGERKFIAKDIEYALSNIPKSLASAFLLHVYGYKYREIADEAQTRIGTIKTRISKARKLLKKQLGDYGN